MLPMSLWLLTIVIANFLVDHFGIVPVGFGLMGPAAVYVVGVAFLLRDWVHETLGVKYVLIGIVAGAALSALISPQLALASGLAFLFSELLDMAVYTPLRERRLVTAVLASNVVGIVVDSIIFLTLAFGSLEFLPGQVIGKSWATVIVLPVLWWVRTRREENLATG